jgi:hypothetical protein
MKFFTDIVLQGVAKLKAPFIQLTPVTNATTEMSAARGALYIDVNVTNDSATDYDGGTSSVQKQSLKFNLGTEGAGATADWRDVLSSYDFTNETAYTGINGSAIAAATGAIRRTNVFGGRLINLNLSPRFSSEATSKAYVDYKSSNFGSYTFAGSTSVLTYTKSPALNLPRPGIVVTVYQITNASTQAMEVVYPDISVVRSGSGTSASPYFYNFTLSFASAPGTADFLVAYNC